MTERRPFAVACRPCGHVWVAAWLPMEVHKVAAITRRLMCPACAAGAKSIFIATAAQVASLTSQMESADVR